MMEHCLGFSYVQMFWYYIRILCIDTVELSHTILTHLDIIAIVKVEESPNARENTMIETRPMINTGFRPMTSAV